MQITNAIRKVSKLELRRALHFVWKAGPGWSIASIVLVVIEGLMPFATLLLTKLVLDAVTAGLAMDDKEAAFGPVLFFIILLGLVTLGNSIITLISEFVGEVQSHLVTDHMYDILQAKAVEVDLEYYENAKYYDTLHRAQQDAPFRPIRIVNALIGIGQNSVSLVAMIGLLVSIHWGVALVLCVASLPGMVARLRYSDKLHRWQREQTPLTRKAGYFNWMLTGDAHAKENRLFNLGGLFQKRSAELRTQLRQERIRMARRYYVIELLARTSSTVAVFLSYAFIAYRTVMGYVTLGDLVMYYQAFQRGQGFLTGLLRGLSGLYENSLFLSDLYEFLDLKRTVVEPTNPQPLPRPMREGIVFDHVSFQYPNTEREALEDVSLNVGPGEVVALVGENGSGKTTLIKLLCRLYEPTSGSITIDGIDISQFRSADLRREIGVIFQDYAHYHLTARENVWFGNVELPPEDGQIIEASRYSGADDVLRGLPKGYDTILGKWFEDGEELSIGQWQKVALARAFLRGSQVIVLDEPTSAMDARAEYEVFAKFRELARGRSAILISHRLSTVKMADYIYVMENGRIIESGTHDELMARTGTYARMFEIQAQNYR